MMENKTFISIEFWQLVGFLLSFLGVCWGFGKMLLAQFQNQQAERQRQFETMRQKYVLREDYIRNQAVLEAKMDSIQHTLTDLYKIESQKK